MEEALRRIKRAREVISENIIDETAKNLVHDLEIAAEAIEKQTAKAPDIEGDGCDREGNIIYDTWICPCCGRYYELEFEEYKHCPECGQKIDWTDITE